MRSSPADVVPSLDWETRLGHPSALVAGVDEVGRGCLAGPVVACAVVLPGGNAPEWVASVRDSKLLSPAQRERLAPEIRAWALGWGLGSASVEEIERLNILQASHVAMVRALGDLESKWSAAGLARRVERVLVDGNRLPGGLDREAVAVVGGDRLCLSVACASVVAKVWRDAWMTEAAKRHPGYGFEAHKGYSTPEHGRALRERGPCELHRRTFAPVSEALQAAPASP